MIERILTLSIYSLIGTIVLILAWVIIRELLAKSRQSRQERQSRQAKKRLKAWLWSAEPEQKMILAKLKALGPVAFIEPFFFELFDMSSKNEKTRLQKLFQGLGIQRRLRQILKESPNIDAKEEAVLKMGHIGMMNDLIFLLAVFRDETEDDQVKQCCVEAIAELCGPLLREKEAVDHVRLLVQLLEIPNEQVREQAAYHLARLPLPPDTMIPHLMELTSDSAKQGVLTIFKQWNRRELAHHIYPYIHEFHPGIRRTTIELLGQWQNEGALFLFSKHLKDPDPSVRFAMIQALFNFKNRAAKKMLTTCFEDHSVEIQAKTGLAFAMYRHNDRLPKLIQKIKNDDFRKIFFAQLKTQPKDVQQKVFRFIGIDPQIYVKYFKKDFLRYDQALVKTAEQSEDPRLRGKALKIISTFNPKALSVLLKKSTQDPDETVRFTAQKLLEKERKKANKP